MDTKSILIFAALILVLSCFCAYARPHTPWIYGIHDWNAGAASLFRPYDASNGYNVGWTVQNILSSDTHWENTFNTIANTDHLTIICRINWGGSWHPTRKTTVPINDNDWTTFTEECKARIRQLGPYCNIFIIGNRKKGNKERRRRGR